MITFFTKYVSVTVILSGTCFISGQTFITILLHIILPFIELFTSNSNITYTKKFNSCKDQEQVLDKNDVMHSVE